MLGYSGSNESVIGGLSVIFTVLMILSFFQALKFITLLHLWPFHCIQVKTSLDLSVERTLTRTRRISRLARISSILTRT